MLTRISSAIITSLLFSQLGFAQNEFATVQLPSKLIDNYWIIPDDQGNICVQYFKRPNLYFDIINKSGERVKQIQQPFKYLPTIFAGNYSNGKFQFYYEPRSRKKEGDIGAFTINRDEAKFEKQMRYDLKASNSEEFIGHFNEGNKIYLFIQVRGTNLIRIAMLNGQSESEVKNFPAPELLKSAFKSYDPFVFVNPLAPKSIYGFQSTKKVYSDDGKFYFTFDQKEQFNTQIWTIDWEEGTAELTKTPDKKMVFGRSSNSFLYENSLFRWTVDEVKVDLSVYDLNGKDSVRTYNKTGEGDIPFQTGSIKFIDEYGAQHSITTMKNDKLFKSFSNGNPSVFVERINDSNIKVTAGAFNEMATGLSIGGGLGSFGRAGGISIGGSRQLTGTRRGSTFIHSFLTYPSLDISEGDNLLTPNERIFRYLDNNRRNITTSKIYSYNDQIFHLAYLDYNEAKLQIVEFRK